MKTLVVIIGPTGIGKTALAVELAQKFNTEIISCDSRQFYQELKIGTAVPSEDELAAAKHHFIGQLSIHDYYNASTFEFEVIDLLNKKFQQFATMLMVGGSGMYVDAVCQGIDDLPEIDQKIRANLERKYQEEGIESLRFELKKLDPEYYDVVDLRNPKRILKGLEICMMTGKTYTSFRKSIKKERNFDILKIGLTMDREKLYERIERRVDLMVEQGLIEEAKEFYPLKHLNSLNTVGYKELFAHFNGEYDINKAVELIKRNSRRYAKRQLSWFNRDNDINWFNRDDKVSIWNFIKKKISDGDEGN